MLVKKVNSHVPFKVFFLIRRWGGEERVERMRGEGEEVDWWWASWRVDCLL